MKTFFAVRICDGSGAAGAMAALCASTATVVGSIIANPRHATANLTFGMISSTFLLL
jgi:hypothetical protein